MIEMWVACLVAAWLCLAAGGVGCLAVAVLEWAECHEEES